MKTPEKRPEWLKVKARATDPYRLTTRTLERLDLTTVCRESGCPNIWECWDRREATFLVLGDTCTRACLYCRVDGGRPAAVDPDEPRRVAAAVAELELKYVVVTSVTRDDLPDGGAGHFAAVTRAVRAAAPDCRIELLVPDFRGRSAAVATVLEAGADMIGHNIETIKRLFPLVRPSADYARSLALLARFSAGGAPVKSGLMVGLGEGPAEVRNLLKDLRAAGVDMVTVGQYLAPTREHFPVARYWRPEEFLGLAAYAKRLGFSRVLSGPLVRSSYRNSNSGHFPEDG